VPSGEKDGKVAFAESGFTAVILRNPEPSGLIVYRFECTTQQ